MEMSLNIRPKNCYEHALQFRQSLQIRQQHSRGIIELNYSLISTVAVNEKFPFRFCWTQTTFALPLSRICVAFPLAFCVR